MANYTEAFKKEAVSFHRYSQNSIEDSAQMLRIDSHILYEWIQNTHLPNELLTEKEKHTLETLFFETKNILDKPFFNRLLHGI